jgi:hypothetical protein
MSPARMKGQAARLRVRHMRPLKGEKKRGSRAILLSITRRQQRRLPEREEAS